MAKRRPLIDHVRMHQRIKTGYGQGVGETYRPWLRIQDVPSRGVVGRIRSQKTGRVMHLMSILEQQFALCFDFSPAVIDLREQFPLLPVEATFEIAHTQGVKHPTNPHNKEEIVMTTDFLVTLCRDGSVRDIAFAAKLSSDILNVRVREKLKIERRYWQERNIEWYVITEKSLGQQFVRNLRWLHPYTDISSLWPHSASTIAEVAVTLTNLAVHHPQRRLADLCVQCDTCLGLQQSRPSSLAVARYLLANQLWVTDLVTFRLHTPLTLLHIANDIKNLVGATV